MEEVENAIPHIIFVMELISWRFSRKEVRPSDTLETDIPSGKAAVGVPVSF